MLCYPHVQQLYIQHFGVHVPFWRSRPWCQVLVRGTAGLIFRQASVTYTILFDSFPPPTPRPRGSLSCSSTRAPFVVPVAIDTVTAHIDTHYCRNEQLKAEEASFRQARENLLQDLEKRVKEAKTALGTASTALKKQERLSKV